MSERIKALVKKYAPRSVYFFLYRLYKYWQVWVLGQDTSLSLADFDRRQFKELEYAGVHFSLLLDPDNGSLDKEIFLKGVWEEDSLAIIREYVRTDGVCLDVGANIGSLTIFMALMAKDGRVHAFEPLGRLCDQIRESARHNNLDNVSIHQYGLSDSDFDQVVNVNLLNVGKTTLDNRDTQGKPQRITVKRFDDVWDKNSSVDFVKIDVEGHEYQVLLGMAEMLTRDRPVLLFEYSPVFYAKNGTNCRDLLNFVLGLGYKIFDLNDQRKECTSEGLEEFLQRCKFQTDLLCLPGKTFNL